MTLREIDLVLIGAIAVAYALVGLFFFRFWRKTSDPLFCFFASGFWVLMLEEIVFLSLMRNQQAAAYVYLIRLLGFGLIFTGIIKKNYPKV